MKSPRSDRFSYLNYLHYKVLGLIVTDDPPKHRTTTPHNLHNKRNNPQYDQCSLANTRHPKDNTNRFNNQLRHHDYERQDSTTSHDHDHHHDHLHYDMYQPNNQLNDTDHITYKYITYRTMYRTVLAIAGMELLSMLAGLVATGILAVGAKGAKLRQLIPSKLVNPAWPGEGKPV